MRLGQTSAVFFIAKFASSILGFITTVIFARLLGEAVLGQYATVLAMVTWFTLITSIGVSESVTKRLSEGEELDKYTGAGLIIVSGITIILSILLLLFRQQVNAYVGAPVAVILVGILLTSVMQTIGSAALHGRHMVHISSVVSILTQFVRSGGQIIFLLVGYGIQAMLSVYAFSWLFSGLLAFKFIDTWPKMPSKRHFKSLFDFAKFSWLGNIQSRVFGTLDILVLKLFVASEVVGVYSVAWSIGLILDIFANSIQTTLFPEMSKTATKEGVDSVAGLTEDALLFTGLLLIPGLIGGLMIGDRLLRIYGEGFSSGTEVLGILLLALLIYAYTKQLLNTLNAVDRPDLAFRTNGVFIGGNIVLNFTLIPIYGWVGAAVATLLSGVIGVIVSGYYVNRLLDISPPVKEIGRQWIAAAGMGAVVYGARLITESYWIAQHNAAYVIGLVIAGALVYFGTLAVISTRFRTTVISNIPVDQYL